MLLCSSVKLGCLLLLQPTFSEHDLNWNIASDLSGSQTPNVLSDLKYRDVEIWSLGLGGEFRYLIEDYDLTALLEFGWSGGDVDRGRYSDADYSGDNRTQLASLSAGSVLRGDLDASSLAIGVSQPSNDGMHEVSFLVGISRDELSVRMQNGHQLFIDNGLSLDEATSQLEGLNSRYAMEWKTHWLALEYSQKIKIGHWFIRATHHRGDFEAEADWNLRTDFKHTVSFRHKADVEGQVYSIGLKTDLENSLHLRLVFRLRDFDTDNGVDTTYLNNGSLVETRLNKAEWRSQVIEFGIGWNF